MDVNIRFLYDDILYYGYKIESVDYYEQYIEVYLNKNGKQRVTTIYKY